MPSRAPAPGAAIAAEVRMLRGGVSRHDASISELQRHVVALAEAMRQIQGEWDSASRAILELQRKQQEALEQQKQQQPQQQQRTLARGGDGADQHRWAPATAAASDVDADVPARPPSALAAARPVTPKDGGARLSTPRDGGGGSAAPAATSGPAPGACAATVGWGDISRALAGAGGAVPSGPAAALAVRELDRLASRLAGGAGPLGSARDRDQSERDDCASTLSFATTRSVGSTQLSAPVLLTDLPAAGRSAMRIGGGAARAAISSGGGFSGEAASATFGLAAAGGGAGGLGGTHAAAAAEAEFEVQEECSKEQLLELMDQLRASCPSDASSSAIAGPAAAGASCGVEAGAQEAWLERRRDAVSALALHAERDAELRAALVAGGLLGEVADMLEGGDLRCTWAAAHLAWYISRSDELRPDLGGVGRVIPALVALLGAPDPGVSRAAALALNNLALDAGCRQRMAEAGAVNALVDMMASSDAIGQEASSAALMVLASEEGNIRARIVAANGVRALVDVLQYGGPTAQESAACALENLSLDAACEAALGAEGGIEGLIGLLRDGTPAAQAAAIGALRNLAVNDDLQHALLAAGGVPTLLDAALGPHGAATRTAAVEALRNLAVGSSEACTLLVASGGAAAMVGVAHALPGPARLAALGVLLVLSVEEPHKQALMASGTVGVLVHSALSGSPAAKEYAARTLTNLATGDANRMDILKEGAATVLAALLRSGAGSGGGVKGAAAAGGAGAPADRACRYVAARALQNLSKCRQPQARRLMLDAGCVAALVGALPLDGPTPAAAVSALFALCGSPRALQELARADGAGQLLAALGRLQGRSHQQAVKLLRRLAKASGVARIRIQEALGSGNLPNAAPALMLGA